VYFSVSPGSALPSRSTSVNSESFLVAVTVGATSGAERGWGATVRFELTAVEWGELFAASAFTGALAGCDFHNQPARLDSTETVNATAAKTATPTITRGKTVRVDLPRFTFVEPVFLRERRERFSLRGIWYSFCCLSSILDGI